MPVSNDELSREAFRRFLVLFRFLRMEGRRINSQGIKPRQFAVLRFLHESGPATVGEVQEHIFLSPSATSTLIGHLEEAGYVTRTRSREDNRVVIVALTAPGRDIAQTTPLAGLPLLRRRLRTLPEDRLQVINEALADIMDLMEVTETE